MPKQIYNLKMDSEVHFSYVRFGCKQLMDSLQKRLIKLKHLKKIQQLRLFKWELAESIVEANLDTDTYDSSHEEGTSGSHN